MRRIRLYGIACLLAGGIAALGATSTINTSQRWSWSSTAGWMNWRANSTNGVVVGQYCLSGWIYSTTRGWMSVGDGTPTNGVSYCNTSTNDYGVNHDGEGHLTGYAWCASSGWINFEWTNKEAANAPRLDLQTGYMSGYAWSTSLGWISLSNLSAKVKTDTMSAGTVAPNGIPVAWQTLMTGGTATLAGGTADYDHDGVSDYGEYVAGTHPTNPASCFEIGAWERTDTVTTNITLSWWMEGGRLYQVETNATLFNSNSWYAVYAQWINSGTGGWYETQLNMPPSRTSLYYRIRVKLPLTQ